MMRPPRIEYAGARWLAGAVGIRDSRAGWRAYCSRLGEFMEDETAREELTAKHLSRGWCVGGAEFRSALRQTMGERLDQWRDKRFAGLEPSAVKAERVRAWEDLLVRCARVAKIDLTKLDSKKSAKEKVLLAAVMKQGASVSNGWLAERLKMGEPASASQFVRRWLAEPKQTARVKTLLSKVKV